MFSGSKRVSKATLVAGLPWVLSYDSLADPIGQDLSRPDLQSQILRWIAQGTFALLCGGTPRSSFSVCITPPVRARAYPPRSHPGLRLAWLRRFVSGAGSRSSRLDVLLRSPPFGHFWIENPRSSWLWKQRECVRLSASRSSGFWDVGYCRFGAKWKKATHFFSNLQAIMAQKTRCQCTTTHLRLHGTSPRGAPWTQIAEPYPHGIAQALAWAAAIVCLDRPRRLDLGLTRLLRAP